MWFFKANWNFKCFWRKQNEGQNASTNSFFWKERWMPIASTKMFISCLGWFDKQTHKQLHVSSRRFTSNSLSFTSWISNLNFNFKCRSVLISVLFCLTVILTVKLKFRNLDSSFLGSLKLLISLNEGLLVCSSLLICCTSCSA